MSDLSPLYKFLEKVENVVEITYFGTGRLNLKSQWIEKISFLPLFVPKGKHNTAIKCESIK